MSRILFHSRNEPPVEVLGSERAWMGSVVKDIACAFIPFFEDSVRPHLVAGLQVRPDQWFHRDIRMWLGNDSPVFQVHGVPLDSFQLLLNTAVVAGSDPVCVMARLHGQCEIHAYVEGPDRAWLAGVIEQGREAGLMRRTAGWESVVDLLGSRDDAPVVTSYTVTDGFPNPNVAGLALNIDGEPDWDLWGALPADERWAMAIAGLRAQTHLTPIAPETLRGHLFGHGKTLLDVFQAPAPVRA